MSILINPSGRVVEVDENQIDIKSLIKKGFKLASEDQESDFLLNNDRAYNPPSEYIQFKTSEVRFDGYGMSSLSLEDAMKEEDIGFTRKYIGQDIGLVYSYPTSINQIQTKTKLIYTMFESTKIPEDWIESLQKADKVFVPSKFCQEAFASRGIDTTVIPLGYSSKAFFYDTALAQRKDPEIFTFLHYDAFNTRKGWDILFKAFTEEFGDDRSVQLILKTVKDVLPLPIPRSQYPNIEVIKEQMTQDALRILIHKADCFVFPSRGEGFGLTPLEALACGVPSIVPNGSGMSEYFDERYFIDVDFRMRPSLYERKDFTPANTGEMIEVTVESLKLKMREAYNNRLKLAQMGAEGSEWVKSKYTISHTAKLLKSEINKFLGEKRKLSSTGNKHRPLLSIIMLTYDALRYTKASIDSIKKYAKADYELILIDNNSSDGTQDYLKTLKNEKNIKVVLNSENKGVAGGRNQGIEMAEGGIIVFLDNDTTIKAGWDTAILQEFENPRVGVVGKQGNDIKSWIPLTWEKLKFVGGRSEGDVVAGFCFAFLRELIPLVGNLWTDFPNKKFWHEDLEFCQRVKKAGYKIIINHNIPIIHYEHKSMKGSILSDENQFGYFENAKYITRRLSTDNIIYIYRDYKEDSFASYDILARQFADYMRSRGFVVIQKEGIDSRPASFNHCKGFDIEFKGSRFILLHQENDRPPKSWVKSMRTVDIAFCSSPHVLEACSNEEYADKLIPLTLDSYDPDVFNYEIPSLNDFYENKFIFLNVGASQPRKNTENLISAFLEEFEGEQDVILIIKNGGYGQIAQTNNFIRDKVHSGSPSIAHISDNWDKHFLASVYRTVAERGVYVHPHRAECFGLPLIEATACGCNIITTKFGGAKYILADYDNVSFVPFEMKPSTFHNNKAEKYYTDDEKPQWAEPDIKKLKESMRLAFKNWQNGLVDSKRSREMSERVKKEYSSEVIYNNIFNYLKNYEY